MVLMRRLTPENFRARVHALSNGTINTSSYKNTRTKVSARCSVCGHHWDVVPASLLKGTGCPLCGKRKAAQTPKHTQAGRRFLAWAATQPFEVLTPYLGAMADITAQCSTCGGSWDTNPRRLRKYGCPVCGHIKTGQALRKSQEVFEDEVAEIHGGHLRVRGSYRTGKDRIEVECLRCSHVWKPVAGRLVRSSGRGCPRCCQSKGEIRIAALLSGGGVPFKQEVSFKDLRSPWGGVLRFDFGVLDQAGNILYLIEYDGRHHFRPLDHQGGAERFRRQQVNDATKTRYCQDKGLPLLRISLPPFKMRLEDLGCP